jgi:hypothetical protein
VDGQKLAWSVTDYLASLTREVATLLELGANAALMPETGPMLTPEIQHAGE